MIFFSFKIKFCAYFHKQIVSWIFHENTIPPHKSLQLEPGVRRDVECGVQISNDSINGVQLFNQLPKGKTATQQGLWREGTVQLGIFLQNPKNTKRIIWIYRTFEWTSQPLRLLTDLSPKRKTKTHKKGKFVRNKRQRFFCTSEQLDKSKASQACRTLQRF